MARRKTMELPDGKKVFERQQPLEGLEWIEKLTRPVRWEIVAWIDTTSQVTWEPGQIDPRAIITE